MAAFIERTFVFRQYLRRILRIKRCTGKNFCTQPATKYTSVLLNRRGHIEVTGVDSVKFLQGLLTNDVNLFHCDSQILALYSMILNIKGRVLHDLILYKHEKETPGFLIECDLNSISGIIKTFKPYKLRSKVSFNDVSDEFNSWVVIEEGAEKGLQSAEKKLDSIVLVKDPRLALLGARLVLPKTARPTEYYSNVMEISDQNVYDDHRVGLGVGEGLKDIEPGVPLPLEYNVNLLHGVSFQKGCYIGQELTARTHHTGVIRKRLMPIKLTLAEDHQLHADKGATIKTTSGKRAGKLISVYGAFGLGLMRLDVVKSADGLSVAMSDGKIVDITVNWPTWWNLD